jgi:flagellar motor switch protein FliN/FliY
VALDRLEGEPLEIKLNGKLVARGEAVVVDGHLGVRLSEVAVPDASLGRRPKSLGRAG